MKANLTYAILAAAMLTLIGAADAAEPTLRMANQTLLLIGAGAKKETHLETCTKRGFRIAGLTGKRPLADRPPAPAQPTRQRAR